MSARDPPRPQPPPRGASASPSSQQRCVRPPLGDPARTCGSVRCDVRWVRLLPVPIANPLLTRPGVSGARAARGGAFYNPATAQPARPLAARPPGSAWPARGRPFPPCRAAGARAGSSVRGTGREIGRHRERRGAPGTGTRGTHRLTTHTDGRHGAPHTRAGTAPALVHTGVVPAAIPVHTRSWVPGVRESRPSHPMRPGGSKAAVPASASPPEAGTPQLWPVCVSRHAPTAEAELE